MLPTRAQALKLVDESEKLNPGPWKQHSLAVGECAQKIAERCPDMDADKAFIVGVVHDIGRRFSKKHMQHVIDGYRYMTELGYDEAARVCMSHSFHSQDIHEYIGNRDVTDAEYAEIERYINAMVYDDYDRLIQLCDSLVLDGKAVEVVARMDDVARRYGHYPQRKRDRVMELKRYFEEKMGDNLYRVVSTDEALWGL